MAVEEFLTACVAVGRSSATVAAYEWHLWRAVAWLQAAGVVSLAEVDRGALRRWAASNRDGWSAATCRQAVCAGRSWLRWCGEEYGVGGDLVSALAVPRVARRVQRTLSMEEVVLLLAACDDGLVGLRNEALVSVLVDVGLRAAEVCRLAVDGVHLDVGRLDVIVKGGSRSSGWFGMVTGQRLRRWLEVRPAGRGTSAVFVGIGGRTPGQPLTAAGLRCVLRRLGDAAGVPGVSPHAFRRAFACLMTEAGAPSRVVQVAGRWSNIEMVERYTRGMETGRLVRRYSAADFVDSLTVG